MGIAEEIGHRCQQVSEEAAQLLKQNYLSPMAVQARQRAADIAGQAAFSLLQKAFITSYDREDVWAWHHETEGLLRAAQNAVLSGTPNFQAAEACHTLAAAAEQFLNGSDKTADTLFSAERQFRKLQTCNDMREVARCGLESVFRLQYLVLKKG